MRGQRVARRRRRVITDKHARLFASPRCQPRVAPTPRKSEARTRRACARTAVNIASLRRQGLRPRRDTAGSGDRHEAVTLGVAVSEAAHGAGTSLLVCSVCWYRATLHALRRGAAMRQVSKSISKPAAQSQCAPSLGRWHNHAQIACRRRRPGDKDASAPVIRFSVSCSAALHGAPASRGAAAKRRR